MWFDFKIRTVTWAKYEMLMKRPITLSIMGPKIVAIRTQDYEKMSVACTNRWQQFYTIHDTELQNNT
jgi:hypothetical protein